MMIKIHSTVTHQLTNVDNLTFYTMKLIWYVCVSVWSCQNKSLNFPHMKNFFSTWTERLKHTNEMWQYKNYFRSSAWINLTSSRVWTCRLTPQASYLSILNSVLWDKFIANWRNAVWWNEGMKRVNEKHEISISQLNSLCIIYHKHTNTHEWINIFIYYLS